MQLRIADTFIDSLSKLTNDEQKAAKITVFDLQSDPSAPGLRWHKLGKLKDRRFASVSVNMDLRIIVHRADESLLLCYVDHHDKAYAWAARRKLETHPKTGAAQFVEVREKVREIDLPRYVEAPPAPEQVEPAKPPLFTDVTDDELLGYGVPAEWLEAVREADEDELLKLVDHLPAEAGEALLAIAVGQTPAEPVVAEAASDPFEHPDAKRRFRLVATSDELQRALDYPWDRWAVFLHPSQREIVERQYNGPARVAGSAGTGKTVVALHRAAALARQYPQAAILVTTFSIALARMLRVKMRRLVGDDGMGECIRVRSIDEFALEMYEQMNGRVRVATPAMIQRLVEQAAVEAPEHQFSTEFLVAEWTDVVDAWQIDSWESYRDVQRLGRKTRLGEKQRETLWAIFEKVRHRLGDGGLVTIPGVFAALADLVQRQKIQWPRHIVVDESQDISVPQLRLLAVMAGDKTDGLFFAGDLGQRIFQTPFSWKSLGVNVRGRSRTLKINYRTSHQIRGMADRLLDGEITDVDGNVDNRRGTVSAFRGPQPEIAIVDDETDETDRVSKWLQDRIADRIEPHEIGMFVRTGSQVDRPLSAIKAGGLQASRLDAHSEPPVGKVAVGLMHDAKGLEFRAVAVMACDDEVVPLQERIEAVVDDSDLEEVYNTERHLLYVACTRARDHLLVTGIRPASEFLDDLQPTNERRMP